ncbi:SHOCT domain-containing protein [Streptomyces sp. NPDC059582]|uniref:SHOCT domain-containing protein n=1 Tax=Streptomyces sp. NPDC059582 TaxID=3346875 RepID=UPI0036C392B0
MPGLLRGVARTAAVAGTATAVSNRVSRRQQGRWARQEVQRGAPQQPAPAVAPPPVASDPLDPADSMSIKIDQLKELGDLKAEGALTEAEFAEQKRRILG